MWKTMSVQTWWLVNGTTMTHRVSSQSRIVKVASRSLKVERIHGTVKAAGRSVQVARIHVTVKAASRSVKVAKINGTVQAASRSVKVASRNVIAGNICFVAL